MQGKSYFSKFYENESDIFFRPFEKYGDFVMKMLNFVDFSTQFSREKRPPNNFSRKNFSIENNIVTYDLYLSSANSWPEQPQKDHLGLLQDGKSHVEQVQEYPFQRYYQLERRRLKMTYWRNWTSCWLLMIDSMIVQDLFLQQAMDLYLAGSSLKLLRN